MISVFKTSLIEDNSVDWLERALNELGRVLQWNVDFEDCDHILRIVSTVPVSQEIIEILSQNGHDCIELF